MAILADHSVSKYKDWVYQYLQGCVRCGTGILGTGMDVLPNLPKCPVPVLMSYRTYRSFRYRYWCRTELTEVSGNGIDAVPKLQKCPVPVWKSVPVPAVPVSISFIEVSGTGIDVVPKLPKCPVPVLMPYRTYRNIRYRYWCRTELTEVSGTGNTAGMPRYVPYRTHPWINCVLLL